MSLDPASVPFLHSCERCRQKKRKCSGDKPACAWCRGHGIPCRYRRSMRFKKQLEGYPLNGDAASSSGLAGTGSGAQQSESLANMYTPVPLPGPNSAQAASAPQQPRPFSQTSPATVAMSLAQTQPQGSSPGFRSRNMSLASNLSLMAGTINSPNMVSQPLVSVAASSSVGGPAISAAVVSTGMLSSMDALSRLLSVDMPPLSEQPPENLLQYVNAYMTPIPGAAVSAPEWLSSNNAEANILANLGDLAASGSVNGGARPVPLNFTDNLLGFSQMGSASDDFLSSDSLFPTGGGVYPGAGQGPSLPTAATTAQQLLSSIKNTTSTQQGSLASQSPPLNETGSPVSVNTDASYHQHQHQHQFQQQSATSFNSLQTMIQGPVGAGLGLTAAAGSRAGSVPTETANGRPPYQMASPQPANAPVSSLPVSHQPTQQTPKEVRRVSSAEPKRAIGYRPFKGIGDLSHPVDELQVPAILKEYVKPLPDNASALTIYKIMRETFKAPRMGLVSMNLEVLWYMLHKNVLPRIVFYGHISSNIRCSSANLDIRAMLPPNIDELCYDLALKEVPKIKGCSEIWGAIALCMVTRYEFQSSRYNEMDEHVNIAMEIMYRVKYKGHAYPWTDVPEGEKENFGYQYLLAIFWKCVLWKVVATHLTDHPIHFKYGVDRLPDYASKTYDLYTTKVAYDVDLMEMIPANSWYGADPDNPPTLRFRGPSDPEFMQMRPEGSPCLDRTVTTGHYLQQLLVMFAKFLDIQCRAREGKLDIIGLLKGLWVNQEDMRKWRYALPSEILLDSNKVSEYIEMLKPNSSASLREIDIRASQLKDMTVLLLLYHTSMIRANRFVMKAMLGEPLSAPAPNVETQVFGIRDLYDSTTSPKQVRDSIGHMNFYFHGCRIQAVKSANSLCHLVQAAYACKFNFYTLGSPIIFSIFELMVVHISFLRSRDSDIGWRAKSRLANIFNILRMLRHWAPALHTFVAGIRCLSDPTLCLDNPPNMSKLRNGMIDASMLAMTDMPANSGETSDEDAGGNEPESKRRRRAMSRGTALDSLEDARKNIETSTAPLGSQQPVDVKRDETLSYDAADPIPEFPNPYPPNHVITLIIKDLGLSLAEFLAPSYPILLLKLIPIRAFVPGQSAAGLFGGVSKPSS